ncbi:MAG TPA: hypothetical protein ENK50_03080 [Sedimenticola sp.]|nr:hypothetical protein [Sedimenticola sp.]
MKTMGYMRTGTSLLALALLSACGGSGQPQQAGLEQVAQVIARGENRVDPQALSRWIIEERADFRLIDVRTPGDYGKGHIQGAENLPVTELLLPENLKRLPRDRRLLLYSEGSANAAQAAALLRLEGFDGALLVGGYQAWQREILHPPLPAEATAGEPPEQREQRAIACYFAGGVQAGKAAPRAGRGKPTFKPPTRPVRKRARKGPPPAEEGC